MGVCIEYVTTADVSDETRSQILAAAQEPDDQPWLLCEPISFLDMPGFEDRLFGSSKLNLIPDPEEAADAASCDAEQDDLTFLLDRLTTFSSRFDVDWTIQIEGERIGTIENGICDPSVRDAVEAMAGLADELGDLGEFL